MERDLGLYVCGGRGRHSRNTPAELVAIGDRVGFDGRALATAGRLVAKVAAVQDGCDLYLHGFIVAHDGKWVVVQQGIKGEARQARRYHWSFQGLGSFVDRPHAAIEGRNQVEIVNLTDARGVRARHGTVDLLNDLGFDNIVREVGRRRGIAPDQDDGPLLPHLVMPDHHDVRRSDVLLHRLDASLAAAADLTAWVAQFVDFTETSVVELQDGARNLSRQKRKLTEDCQVSRAARR